jgi:uncharacterized protein (TIGR02466 family)
MIHNLFPTPILIENIIDSLDGVATEKHIVLSKEFTEHGLVENGVSTHGQSSVLDIKELEPLKKVILEKTNNLAKVMGLKKLEISESWCNIMNKDSVVHSHKHQLSVLSGALYIKAGEEAGMFSISNPVYSNHMMYDYINRHTEYVTQTSNIPVTTGTLLIFPSWLEHGVLENNFDSRTVLSFNTMYCGFNKTVT